MADGKNSSTAGEELRQFIERYERLEAEKKDIADGQKEVMAEAKGRGYDTKVMRRLLAERKRDPNDLSEEEAVLEMYRAALGMGSTYTVPDESDRPEAEDGSSLV